MTKQNVLIASDDYKELDTYLTDNNNKKILLVCDSSLSFLKINNYFNTLQKRLGIEVIKFNDFTPNPLYSSVVEGVSLFHKENCDSIITVGGGSAMDVAKCIKLYSNMDASKNYLNQPITPNNIKLLAVPTTAGTGSESTRFAVIYFNGEKQSVTDDSCIPSTILFDSSVLKTLPEYQKKSTMMDALCHAIESYWSVNSNEESQNFSKKAINAIIKNKEAYLFNDDTANANMLQAANLAGKAINITQTTAGHAMCYKLTSLYGIAHGHAAALCVSKLFPYMINHTEKCIDSRGSSYLKTIFGQIAEAMGCDTPQSAAAEFEQLLTNLELETPKAKKEDYNLLKDSVNPVRLKNSPVELDAQTIDYLYHEILQK